MQISKIIILSSSKSITILNSSNKFNILTKTTKIMKWEILIIISKRQYHPTDFIKILICIKYPSNSLSRWHLQTSSISRILQVWYMVNSSIKLISNSFNKLWCNNNYRIIISNRPKFASFNKSHKYNILSPNIRASIQWLIEIKIIFKIPLLLSKCLHKMMIK